MEYDVGDIIEYNTFGGGSRRVAVTNREPDVKNGRPGFDGIMSTPEGTVSVWGYDDQIVRVVKKEADV